MHLGAGAAGAGVSHLPEIVVLVAQQDMVLGKVLEPGLAGLGVKGGPVFLGALENGGVEQLGVDLVNFGQKLPRPVYGFGLEIVSETPVAEHLEHCMVVGVVSDLFEVIMLTADPEALLRVRRPFVRCAGIAQEYVFELVHAGVGEHKCRVVLHHHRG